MCLYVFMCVYVYATNITKEKNAIRSVEGDYGKHSREGSWKELEIARRNDAILLKLKHTKDFIVNMTSIHQIFQ